MNLFRLPEPDLEYLGNRMLLLCFLSFHRLRFLFEEINLLILCIFAFKLVTDRVHEKPGFWVLEILLKTGFKISACWTLS